MSTLTFQDDKDPAMRFEGLIRGAFDCYGKHCDPLLIAAQDNYNGFAEEDDPLRFGRSRAMLCTAIGVLAYRFKDKDCESLKALYHRALSATSQDEIILVINQCLKEAEKLGA